LIAGGSFQGRTFTTEEAWDAAVAVSSLGRDLLPSGSDREDLIDAFRRGWTALHDDVAIYAAAELVVVLEKLTVDDVVIRSELRALRRELTRQLRAGTPWKARDAMDGLASLDLMAHATLLGLIDECPVVVTKGATAFDFISTKTQIDAVHRFINALAEHLRP
jgi:hypothetical protein